MQTHSVRIDYVRGAEVPLEEVQVLQVPLKEVVVVGGTQKSTGLQHKLHLDLQPQVPWQNHFVLVQVHLHFYSIKKNTVMK